MSRLTSVTLLFAKWQPVVPVTVGLLVLEIDPDEEFMMPAVWPVLKPQS